MCLPQLAWNSTKVVLMGSPDISDEFYVKNSVDDFVNGTQLEKVLKKSPVLKICLQSY